MTFQKVRFARSNNPESADDCTAGLILESSKLESMTVSDVSRLFPYSEAAKMRVIQVSPRYPDWEAAFNHQFTANG